MAEGFFDVHNRLKGARAAGSNPVSPESADAPAAITVTQLTQIIDKALKAGTPASITVKGEVSNVRPNQGSGHLYFTLKDATSCINAVMWRDAAARLQFEVQDGLEMIATGRVTVYGPQGRYQLTVNRLLPAGKGALELALRQLQAKLSAEGLFDPERKKPLPLFPARIAIVTSQSTAALQDILKVLRRYPWLHLMLYHVPVQGEGCGTKIAQAIDHLSRCSDDVGGIDAILLSRGGGSLEDLWGFNEEMVARAIARSHIPVITGIGHEIDVSIADLVADYHAHTPTEAAQVITQNWKNAANILEFSLTRAQRAMVQLVTNTRQRLTAIERHEAFRRPLDRIQMLRQLLDDRQKSISLGLQSRLRAATQRLVAVEPRLNLASSRMFETRTTRLQALERQLEALSPQGVLKRGYTMTTLKKTGQILRSASDLKVGDKLLTRFADGEAESGVQDSKQMSLFE